MGNRGFTLLELLMVVIIIAILAAIALPQYFKAAERSRASEALQILATMRGSELRYKSLSVLADYTLNLDDLDVDIPGSATFPLPVTAMWSYTAATGIGANVTATRLGAGPTAGAKIELDVDTGASCTDNVTYGLTASPC